MCETIVYIMFSDWLLAQLASRKWTQTELANRSGLTKQAITNYVNGRIPDKDAINKIAGALRLPVEDVYRVAIGKPQNPEADVWVDEMSHKIKLIPPALRGVASSFINSLLDGVESPKKPKPNHKQKTSTS